ncbi:MAG: type II secretion system ATPase GspE [Rhodoferax sp.]|jgi:general secretion pathway protein E|uniref:type II secretion system ATPase GspE n=1 Tax=Rhodoferax sp. TaxID=50421 RepID=UPI001B69E148|nr:type II secretion system ATPase GspE [Rhodoferax sp.]MBP8287026.1 type II secretion system ATPase GspE [Rhodoferax sp.]MBP9147832.1 type II secretion system ATPase GspE [Rhodoferax sp.]MBP9737445.1 type II secretion system ATPase GspE [Rhodoferax sp.]
MRYPLPYAFARTHQLLLVEDADQTSVWVHPQSNPAALSEVLRKYPASQVHLQAPTALVQRISAAYAQGESSAAAVVSEVESDADLSRMMQELPAIEDLLETADDAPIIRMLNALLTQAARDGASDIHIEPYERHSSVRFRVDGSLREVVQPNRALHAALISRLKIMAELDIAERRLPQDGRISLRIGTRAVDVRVSTLPSAHGERAVLRLLDKSEGRLSLEALGMQGQVLQQFEQLISQPHGIVLVTGPTGSGKTTTLYAALSRLDAGHNNIMTVEDPIEYELAGVGQTQVNPKIELDFAKALRAILRQDPDIIMIGEIRDFETAQIAIQASLTGHLVLATLHTNDAASAVTRLTDMGVEPFLLSSSLLGVLAQRLVRKLCPKCKQAASQGSEADPVRTVFQPVGCEHCGHTGYSGRSGVFELLVTNDGIRAQIHGKAAEASIRSAAQAAGMMLMREDGERLVQMGVTSREELLRVTRD